MAEEITCPACNALNDASAQQCEACGAELDASHEYEFADAADTGNDFEIEEVMDADDEDDFSAGYGFAVEEEIPNDADTGSYNLQEDTSAEADAAYELEVDSSAEDDAAYELEVDSSAEDDAAYELAVDSSEEDVLAADGGMALDAGGEAEAFQADADFNNEAAYELTEQSDAALADAPSEVEDVAQEEAAAEEVVPPELAAILNPARIDREPIAPLPVPGNYVEPASLRVYFNGEELGALAVDSACTLLGRAEDSEPDEAYELEPSRDDFPFEEDLEEEPVFDLNEVSEPSEEFDLEDGAQDAEPADLDSADADALDAAPDDSSDPAVDAYQDPEEVEVGPIIDLSQYGSASKFAKRHGYIFRQNKNYTLCVLSDMGTQLNDEMLDLGTHHKLSHGDVIILGGEVALQFRAPSA